MKVPTTVAIAFSSSLATVKSLSLYAWRTPAIAVSAVCKVCVAVAPSTDARCSGCSIASHQELFPFDFSCSSSLKIWHDGLLTWEDGKARQAHTGHQQEQSTPIRHQKVYRAVFPSTKQLLGKVLYLQITIRQTPDRGTLRYASADMSKILTQNSEGTRAGPLDGHCSGLATNGTSVFLLFENEAKTAKLRCLKAQPVMMGNHLPTDEGHIKLEILTIVTKTARSRMGKHTQD